MVITIFLSISNWNKQVDKDSKKALTINLVHYWMKFSPYELSSFLFCSPLPTKEIFQGALLLWRECDSGCVSVCVWEILWIRSSVVFIRITQSYDNSKYVYENMTRKIHSMLMAYLPDVVVNDSNFP